MQKIQSLDWLHFKFKFQISDSNFQIQNKLLCLQVFAAKPIFITHQHFCFIVFILVDFFSGSIKTEKSQKNLFMLAENNFGARNFRAPA